MRSGTEAARAAAPAAGACRDGSNLRVEKIVPELQGILTGGMSQFIDKRLDHERQGIAVGCTQRAGTNGDRLERTCRSQVGNERMRELPACQAGRAGGLSRSTAAASRIPVVDEVIAPGHELAVGVDAALQVMEPAGAIVVVRQIVFTRPQQLDRNAGFLGNKRGFHHVVIGQAPAKSAAAANHVQRDIALLDSQGRRG